MNETNELLELFITQYQNCKTANARLIIMGRATHALDQREALRFLQRAYNHLTEIGKAYEFDE